MAFDFDGVRKTIRHLCAQTAREALELVLVTQTPAQVEAGAFDGLGAWRVVTLERIRSNAEAWAAGIRASTAPVVVLCEDHSFPAANWAEVLIEEHNGDWAAVGPLVANGNPGTRTCWANYLMCFLEFSHPGLGGPAAAAPGHNTSYAREVLQRYDGELVRWLTSERAFHAELVSQGLRILVTPRTSTAHVNLSKPASMLEHSFHGGRIFGDSRCTDWPWWRRVLQAAAFPLVPWIRLRRIAVALKTPARRRECRFFACLGWLVTGLHIHALGEAVGYVCGAEGAMDAYMSYESHRIEHVIAEERTILRERLDDSSRPLLAS